MASGTFGSLQVATGPTRAAPTMAAVWESATNPPEIVRIESATGRWTPLTKFNSERAARIDWQPLREFWFTSSRGKRIHSFYALPPGSTRPHLSVIRADPRRRREHVTDNFGLR